MWFDFKGQIFVKMFHYYESFLENWAVYLLFFNPIYEFSFKSKGLLILEVRTYKFWFIEGITEKSRRAAVC